MARLETLIKNIRAKKAISPTNIADALDLIRKEIDEGLQALFIQQQEHSRILSMIEAAGYGRQLKEIKKELAHGQERIGKSR